MRPRYIRIAPRWPSQVWRAIPCVLFVRAAWAIGAHRTTRSARPRWQGLFVCALLVGCLGSTLRAAAPQPGPGYVEGEVIVTFRQSLNLEAVRTSLSAHQLQFAKHFALLSRHRQKQCGLVRATNRTTADLIAELTNDPSVEVVEPNYVRRPLEATPDDPLFPQLWGLRNLGQTVNGTAGTAGKDIRFGGAWRLARPSTNPVVVAVIDSGVDYRHPDLVGNMWVNPAEIPNNSVDEDSNGYADDYYGYDFGEGDSDPAPASLHGTHVAGTIAATGNNHLGVIGVDYQAKIMALKVSEAADPASFPDSAIIEAIQYVTLMKERGVNLAAINASFGGPGNDSVMRAAIQAAGDAGIVFCAAAGNDHVNIDATPTYPASYRLPNMIVVAATDQNDGLASFSNYGASTVDLGAPGVNILSTTPTNMPEITSLVRQGPTTFAASELTYSGTTTGLTATIYDCGLGYPTNFPEAVAGNIALIARGTLFFSEKVTNAMAAGARAAVIYNNVSGTFLGTLQSPGDWIPAIGIAQTDGLTLKAALPAIGTVVNFVDPTNVYGYLDGTSMATPHVSGAVALASMNFPGESFDQRIQRIVSNVNVVSGLQGQVRSGGRLDLERTVDSDGNGLPDWWEQMHFGQLTGTDPSADPDHDGANNLAEWLAGTDPLNAASAFRILSAQPVGDDVRVSWTTVGGHRYVLQLATRIGDSLTTNFLDVSPVIAVAGTNEGATNYLHAGGATNFASYYRVRQY